MVAGANFGCGSSREHAPWALEDYGFRAVIAPSFADIFRNNCHKIGLVAVEARPEIVNRIMRAIESDPTLELIIDLPDRRLAVPALDLDEPFDLDDHTHNRLINGLDDIGITLSQANEILDFEKRRESFYPRTVA